jgi:hypothetical protein
LQVTRHKSQGTSIRRAGCVVRDAQKTSPRHKVTRHKSQGTNNSL